MNEEVYETSTNEEDAIEDLLRLRSCSKSSNINQSSILSCLTNKKIDIEPKKPIQIESNCNLKIDLIVPLESKDSQLDLKFENDLLTAEINSLKEANENIIHKHQAELIKEKSLNSIINNRCKSIQLENKELTIKYTESLKYSSKLEEEASKYQQIIKNMEDVIKIERDSYTKTSLDHDKTIEASKNQINQLENKIANMLIVQATEMNDRLETLEKCRHLSNEVSLLIEERNSLLIERKKVVEECVKIKSELINI